jgi:hypothetical protein
MVVYGKKCVQEGEGYQKSCRPPLPEDIFWNSPKLKFTTLSDFMLPGLGLGSS